MSQEQQKTTQAQYDQGLQHAEQEPFKYGDIFDVSGDLASKPIAPQDAAMMRTAEAQALGQLQEGGAAAYMEAAAKINQEAGLVGQNDVTDIAREQGVTVTETNLPGSRVITETVGGQVISQFVQPLTQQEGVPASALAQSAITIGEALEAAAQAAANKPVDQSDAPAIRVAETRATGSAVVNPGGLTATAQSAAAFNATLTRDEDKVTLGSILAGAAAKMGADKAATREDVEGVVSAELRNNPNLALYPGGVAESVTAAARLNGRRNVQ